MDYLAHHGIPHQKWGIRRFQNPDGSLTPEGRIRYGVGKSDKFKDTKFKTSDVYAMEGAKRGGLLGGVIGKVVGMHKEKQERKQNPNGLTNQEQKIFDDSDELERKFLYNSKVLDRTGSQESVNKTYNQLAELCEAHSDKLSAALESAYGRSEVSNQRDAIFDGSLARKIALRFNEKFDVDNTFDQLMDEWVSDYSSGLISRKEFKNHYEAELNDYSAWAIDTLSKDELSRVAKTFTNKTDDTSPNDSWRSYLKRWGEEANPSNNTHNWKDPKATIKQLSKAGYSIGEIAADLPFDLTKQGEEEAYVRRVLGTPSSSKTIGVNVPKSSGRYKTGNSETSSRDALAKKIAKESPKTAYIDLHNAGYRPSEIAKALGQSTKDDGKPSGAAREEASKRRFNKNDIASLKARQSRARSLKSSGKTIAEIADMMGESVPNVKDYLYEDFDSLR